MKTSIKTTAGKTAKVIATLFVACGLIFTSCKKGDTEPAGKDGTNGNANVVSTNTVTLSSAWTHITSNDSYEATVTTSAISQSVVDKGVVMAYVKSTSGWMALPLAAVLVNTDFLKFEIVNGAVNFYYRDNSSSATIDPTSQGWTVRLVIIPAQMKKPNVDHTNYNEVKSAYNL